MKLLDKLFNIYTFLVGFCMFLFCAILTLFIKTYIYELLSVIIIFIILCLIKIIMTNFKI